MRPRKCTDNSATAANMSPWLRAQRLGAGRATGRLRTKPKALTSVSTKRMPAASAWLRFRAKAIPYKSSKNAVPLPQRCAWQQSAQEVFWCNAPAHRTVIVSANNRSPFHSEHFEYTQVRGLKSQFTIYHKWGKSGGGGGSCARYKEAKKMFRAPLVHKSVVPHCSLRVWVWGPEGVSRCAWGGRGEGGGRKRSDHAMTPSRACHHGLRRSRFLESRFSVRRFGFFVLSWQRGKCPSLMINLCACAVCVDSAVSFAGKTCMSTRRIGRVQG